MEISLGIHQLALPIPNSPLKHINCYLIEGNEGWLMVDTGWSTPTALDSLQAGLKDLGLALEDIAGIVLTHAHPDHFGLAGHIKQAVPQAELVMHRWESDLIESRYVKFAELRDKMAPMLLRHGVPHSELRMLASASMPALKYVIVVYPDRVLYGGETVSTGVHNLEIIWTPGHSPGHICLYEPVHQILITGDHVLGHISPNVSYHVQSGDNPLGDYMYSLRKLLHLPVSKVLPAHGEVFSDLRARIDQILEHHERRKAEIGQTIASRPLNAYEVACRIIWNVSEIDWAKFSPLLKRAAITETIAHLECMRWEGRVERVVERDLVSYVLK
ncbi:MAG: MBL fold metallo-hydrolase [Dehalococcoidia bacterium]|nr:MBL fold metallo-hydrolase [Dehalococcoidia bacterium]